MANLLDLYRRLLRETEEEVEESLFSTFNQNDNVTTTGRNTTTTTTTTTTTLPEREEMRRPREFSRRARESIMRSQEERRSLHEEMMEDHRQIMEQHRRRLEIARNSQASSMRGLSGSIREGFGGAGGGQIIMTAPPIELRAENDLPQTHLSQSYIDEILENQNVDDFFGTTSGNFSTITARESGTYFTESELNRAVEALMNPNLTADIKSVNEVLEGLEKKMRGDVESHNDQTFIEI